MNDFSIAFDEKDYIGDEHMTKNVKGRFNRANYEANKQFASVKKIKEALAVNIQIWDVPCIREAYTEDNDTDEDEEEAEGDKDIKKYFLLQKLVESMGVQSKAISRSFKKGVVSFMEEERRALRRHQVINEALRNQGLETKPPHLGSDQQMFRPISAWTLQKNEFLDLDESPADK